jgi:two-component system cell cycle response regulator DivK
MKVLIVEDYTDCRQMLVQMLMAAGLNAIGAMTGEEGVAKAVSEKPDLIIMDLSLPGMSGIEATTKLKLDPTTSHIPIVAFTAWSESEYKRRAVNAGVARFLTKPIAFARLMKIISEIPRTDV